MVKHKKKYLEFFNLREFDYIESEASSSPFADMHHLVGRNMGGSSKNLDEAWNIIPLTRKEHEKAESDKKYNEHLKRLHVRKMFEYVCARLKVRARIIFDE